MNNIKYFSVIYDIQRPPSNLDEKRRDPLFMAKVKLWNSLIKGFVDKLKQYGIRINWSVFLIPIEHRETVEKIITMYRKKFDSLNIRNDIYILEYAPSSNDVIVNKVRLIIKMQLDKLIKKYKEADISERKVIKREIQVLQKLSKYFDAEEMIKGLLSEHGINLTQKSTLEDFIETKK